MKRSSYLAAICLALSPLFSQASVIYQWEATNGETPRGITLELEFDEQTVAGGEFDLFFEQGDGAPLAQGLLALRYTFPNMGEAMRWSVLGNGFASELGRLDMQLRFGGNGFLSGSMYLNDGYHHIELVSSGRTFTVVDANSDAEMVGAGCPWVVDYDCSGATGVIERIDNVAEMPEPGSLALFGAGLLAVARWRRKALR